MRHANRLNNETITGEGGGPEDMSKYTNKNQSPKADLIRGLRICGLADWIERATQNA
jgi:hypothetical protein